MYVYTGVRETRSLAVTKESPGSRERHTLCDCSRMVCFEVCHSNATLVRFSITINRLGGVREAHSSFETANFLKLTNAR